MLLMACSFCSRRILFFLLALALSARGEPSATAEPPPDSSVPHFSTAGFFAGEASPRAVFNFNLGWRFLKGDAPGAQAPDFDDANWEAASLPHGLEILPENASGNRNYQGPAWYRKRFRRPDAAGKKTVLYFEAIMGKCQVWVNGQKVAEHFGGYLPVAADVTGALCPDGADNVVAIRADNSDDPTYPPGKPQHDLDFTYLGGIYRDAFLIQTGAIFVTFPEISATPAGGGVFVGVKDVNGHDAEIEVRTEVANAQNAPGVVVLRTVLEDADEHELLRQEQSLNLPVGGTQEAVQEFSVKNVHLWFPNDPYLHFIRTDLVADGRVVDSLRTRFGARLFEMRIQDGLYINKQPITYKLSGVNRHQDYVHVGNALPKSGQWRDARLLREGGSTIVRAAHEPLSPAFLDACDQLGLLVTDVNPGWQFYNAKDPIFATRLTEDTRAMVRRDRNRPAVLLWETAINETPDQSVAAVHALHVAAHAEYPFPGLYTCTDCDIAREAGLDFYYYANSKDNVNALTREYGDGGEVDNFYSQNAVVRVKREWGELAMLGQLLVRAGYLEEVFSSSKQQIGSCLWAGIDHQRGYHPDPFLGGLVDVFRLPRYSYYLFKSQYDPNLKVPGIRMGPMVYVTHEVTQISGRDVVVLTNCEEVRLTWMGKVFGPQKPDSRYTRQPHPPVTFANVFDFRAMKRQIDDGYHGSKDMVAEGLIGGQVVCRQVKAYAERTSGVALTLDAWDVPLCADGSDFIPVRANIVDQKGVPKVLATEYVHFTVEGPASLIGGGFNQGNPMRTEFGTATALVRAAATPGKITVRAYVDGLTPGEITFDSVSSKLPSVEDEAYTRASRQPAADRPSAITLPGGMSSEADTRKLQDQVRQLELELTSKQQELMDLKGKTGK